MNRAERVASWLYAAAAGAIVLAAIVSPGAHVDAWRAVAGLLGAAACLLALVQRRVPVAFVVVIGLAGLRVVMRPAADTVGTRGLASSAIDLGIGIGLCALLGFVLYRRRGRFDRSDSVDVATVTVGAALTAWIVLASRLVEQGIGAPSAALNASSPVVALVLLTFVLDLYVTGLRSNRSMRFIALGATANVVGTAVIAVGLAHEMQASPDIAAACFLAAFLLVCSAFVLPSISETLAMDECLDDGATYTPVRTALHAASMLVPAVLIASIAPTGDADVAIRIAGLVLLGSLIGIRLVVAVHRHEMVQRALVERLDRDDLTSLPNRRRFVRIVDATLERTWRTGFRPTIVQLNLDRFKNINDSLGHYDANRVLVAVGERLTSAAAAFDGVVARSGGDDFVVMAATTTSTDDAMELVETVRAALAQPFEIAEHNVFVTASFGVAIAPNSRSISADEFMRRADIATHRAKADGRNSASLFDDSMQAHLERRMDVEHALHGAIARQEMRLYYQPIVSTETGVVSGFEALIRWQRPDGMVPPIDFISIAEETGIICELGAWALEEALRDLRGWMEDGVVRRGTTMSVNVSPRQILDPNFADVVRDALATTGVAPHLLWLEMTESMMLEQPELAQTTLRQVCDDGVRLALDDFGTGYSSLSLLQQFPIGRIKIDRAFVMGVSEPGNDRKLVNTIVTLSRALELDIVAEGVETIEQLHSLRALECDNAQGYLISHPVPPAAMRSTMIGLIELQSLSLFHDSSRREVTASRRPDYDMTPTMTPLPLEIN